MKSVRIQFEEVSFCNLTKNLGRGIHVLDLSRKTGAICFWYYCHTHPRWVILDEEEEEQEEAEEEEEEDILTYIYFPGG